MNRIFFLNRYFFPDQSATSQMVSDLAFHLATARRRVHVITSQQLYSNRKAKLPAEEIIGGVHIHRVPTTRFGRAGILGRSADYLSFYAAIWKFAREIIRPGDIIVAMTDPPLLSVLAMRIAHERKARLINWLQDLYPEVATQLGVPFLKGPIQQLLSYWRDQSLNAAGTNIVVGHKMREKVMALDPGRRDVRVIHNWTDDRQIRPLGNADNFLRRDWAVEDKFVVGYCGNLGRAHEYQTILDAALKLSDQPQIVFLFVGGGHNFDALRREVRKLGLDQSFRFVGYQDRGNLVYSLGVPDVHWISLRPEVDGLIVPSKFYGIAAAGKPMIAITASDSEIAELIRKHHCGAVIEPGDSNALVQAITQLSTNKKLCAVLGECSRRMLELHFTREESFRNWRRVFENIEQARIAA